MYIWQKNGKSSTFIRRKPFLNLHITHTPLQFLDANTIMSSWSIQCIFCFTLKLEIEVFGNMCLPRIRLFYFFDQHSSYTVKKQIFKNYLCWKPVLYWDRFNGSIAVLKAKLTRKSDFQLPSDLSALGYLWTILSVKNSCNKVHQCSSITL